jgi:hypothetical protein
VRAHLQGKVTYANVISSICLFLLLGGGAAYAATKLAKNSVGAKQIKNGAITPAKLSAAAKQSLQGAPGPQGERGPEGREGPRGPQGPGAISFEAAVPETGEYHDIKTVNNILIRGFCEATTAAIALVSVGSTPMDVYGTTSHNGLVEGQDVTGASSFSQSVNSGPYEIDFSLIARNRGFDSAFTRFDLHLGASTCKLTGMATPSSSG